MRKGNYLQSDNTKVAAAAEGNNKGPAVDLLSMVSFCLESGHTIQAREAWTTLAIN